MKWYSIIAGTVFLLLLLAVIILIPCPTGPQLNFFRIFIAIAAGAFAATIPGKITVTNKFIVATSAIGVFVLVYLVNPAGWSTGDDCKVRMLKATVYVDEQPAAGVEITIPDLGQQFKTDDFGNVRIDYAGAQVTFPLRLIFRYKSAVDTTILLDQPENKMEFRLQSRKTGSFRMNGEQSLSYQFRDLDFNISLLNPNKFDPDLPMRDTLKYFLRQRNDTIFIQHGSTLLNKIYGNEVLNERYGFDEMALGINLPLLDVKFTNNSDAAVFFHQASLMVAESQPNNNALLIPSGFDDFCIYNIGWGSAKNIRVNYTLVPAKQYQGWKNEFEQQLNFPAIPSGNSGEGDAYVSCKGVEQIIARGVSPRIFQDEFGDPNDLDPQRKRLYDQLVGDFDKGAIFFGKITYTNTDNSVREQKFETFVNVGGGYGAGVEIEYNYNAQLKAEGKAYEVIVPISHGIKPKDFDRLSLTLASPRAGKHFFRMAFNYNNEQVVFPFVFCLDYFITPSGSGLLKKKVG
ncbi:hypothetical protein [Parasegetibacter sp. NRK P23]|uniref:hypothetical protein n=1 Tax=Parasegetibacter sp. NRK P23 TaxID=2942999 RepID=UPI00204386C7|nr:hypothetical protein [Parasegetibacter sp. NRK P23]MCM5529628.1 hypothetical protein [Parasegetibacter sp. NRK P23]